MSKWMSVVAVCAVLCALCALCACGGGGGGASLGAILSGPYCFYIMDLGSGETIWGTALSDGVSTVTFTGDQNDGSTVSAFGPEPLAYAIDPDGSFHLLQGTTTIARGGITGDGRCAVMATAAADIPPLLIVMTRLGGSVSMAGLVGAYHWTWYRLSGGSLSSLFATRPAFDGAGGFAGSVAINDGGAISGGSISGTYGVGSEGRMFLNDFTSTTSEGCLMAGEDFAALGGGTSDTDDLMLSFLLRAGSGLTEATFSGAYWVAGFEDFISSGGVVSLYGTISADGAGNATISATSADGMALAPVTGSGAYTVASDGTLVLNRGGVAGTEDLTGAVSPDGRYAFIGGGAVPGSNPVLYVLIKK